MGVALVLKMEMKLETADLVGSFVYIVKYTS